MIKHIKIYSKTFVIAGLVRQKVLENFAGADATKVGIGPGRVCITK